MIYKNMEEENLTEQEIHDIIMIAGAMAELLVEARNNNLPYGLAKKIDNILSELDRFNN